MKLKPLVISFSLLAFTGAAYAQQQQKEQMNEKDKQAQQSTTQQSTPSQSSQGQSAQGSASGTMSQSAQKDEQKTEGQSAAAGASGSAKTQQSTQAETKSQSTQQSAQQEQDKSDKSAAAGASGGSKQQQGGMTIEQIKDMEVVDSQGKELGEIQDVVIDLTSGKVHAAVLSFGGFLGMGDKHFAFQPSEFKRGKKNDQLVLNVDKQKLENAEGFEKAQWPGMDDQYWRNVGGGKQAGAGGGQSGQMNLIRASELKGKEVQDQSGKKVGEVQAVMIDFTQGQVRNIAVNVEGGGRAMVPAKSIKATGTEDRLVLDMDAQKLKQQAQRTGGQKPRGASGAAGGTAGSNAGAEVKQEIKQEQRQEQREEQREDRQQKQGTTK